MNVAEYLKDVEERCHVLLSGIDGPFIPVTFHGSDVQIIRGSGMAKNNFVLLNCSSANAQMFAFAVNELPKLIELCGGMSRGMDRHALDEVETKIINKRGTNG